MAGYKKIMLVGSIAFAMILGYLYFGVYNKPHIDIKKAKTEIRISSKNLVSSFLDDEALANSKFVEKTLEVDGTVKEINFLNDRYTLFLDGGDTFSCLMCDMNSDQINDIQQLRPGQTIKIKGICKGFLDDAILLNCVLLQ